MGGNICTISSVRGYRDGMMVVDIMAHTHYNIRHIGIVSPQSLLTTGHIVPICIIGPPPISARVPNNHSQSYNVD